MRAKKSLVLMLIMVLCVTLISGVAFAHEDGGGKMGGGAKGSGGKGGGAKGPKDVAMGRTSTIAVYVYDENGAPADGADIQAVRYEDQIEILSTSTTINGYCVLEGIHGFGEVVIEAFFAGQEAYTPCPMRGYQTEYEAEIFF